MLINGKHDDKLFVPHLISLRFFPIKVNWTPNEGRN